MLPFSGHVVQRRWQFAFAIKSKHELSMKVSLRHLMLKLGDNSCGSHSYLQSMMTVGVVEAGSKWGGGEILGKDGHRCNGALRSHQEEAVGLGHADAGPRTHVAVRLHQNEPASIPHVPDYNPARLGAVQLPLSRPDSTIGACGTQCTCA